jgi:hypothetical protein
MNTIFTSGTVEPQKKKQKGKSSSSAPSLALCQLPDAHVVSSRDGFVSVRCENIGGVVYVFSLSQNDGIGGLFYVVRGSEYVAGGIMIQTVTVTNLPSRMMEVAMGYGFDSSKMFCFYVPYKENISIDGFTNIFICRNNFPLEQEYKLIPKRFFEVPWVANNTRRLTQDPQKASTVPVPLAKTQRKRTAKKTGIDLPLLHTPPTPIDQITPPFQNSQSENKDLSVSIGTQIAAVVSSTTTVTANKQKRKQRVVKRKIGKESPVSGTDTESPSMCNLPVFSTCNGTTEVPPNITQSENELGAVRVDTQNRANVPKNKPSKKRTEYKEANDGIKAKVENQHPDPDETDLSCDE